MGDDPVQVKFECKEVDPCENSRVVHISPHNSGTGVQLMQIESRPWAFQRAINQGRASSLTSPQWASDIQICHFRRNFDQKHQKSATKFHCLKTPSGKVVARSTTYQMAGMSSPHPGLSREAQKTGLGLVTVVALASYSLASPSF